MRVVALSRDLNVAAKLRMIVRASDETETVSTLSQAIARVGQRSADVVLVDLTCQVVDVLVVDQLRQANRLPCTLAAFGPHVQEQKLAAASVAGCDHVWPRGRWEQELRKLLD